MYKHKQMQKNKKEAEASHHHHYAKQSDFYSLKNEEFQIENDDIPPIPTPKTTVSPIHSGSFDRASSLWPGGRLAHHPVW